MQNDPMALIALIAGIAVLLAIIVATHHSRQRHRMAVLREYFGHAYDQAVEKHAGQARTEGARASRQTRPGLEIQLLSAEQHRRFAAAWAAVRGRFLDDPLGAVIDADVLVKEVMQARGYPVGNFEQRAADLSVEHANVVDHYRAARKLALVDEHGQADTEELRQAIEHYSALFSDLLQPGVGHGSEDGDAQGAAARAD